MITGSSFKILHCGCNTISHVNNKIHFEISERKMILYLFDLFFLWLWLYLASYFFDLEYLETVATQLTAAIVLGIYLSIFGVIFEMYKLQVASNEFQILKYYSYCNYNRTCLFVNAYFFPILPSNRLQF
jgi:positive regulator of sigma E activity